MPTDDKRLAAVIVQHKSVADWVACLRRCSPSPGVVGTEQMYSTALSHLYRVFLQAAWSLVIVSAVFLWGGDRLVIHSLRKLVISLLLGY